MTENNKKAVFKTALITAGVTLALTLGALFAAGFLSVQTPGTSSSAPVLDESRQEHHLYTCGMHPWIISEEPGDCPVCGMKLTPKRDEDAPEEASGERTIVYWRAPNDPEEIYDGPGKSKSGGELIPVYEDELIAGVEIRIDPVTQQNMGLRTAIVETGPLAYTIRTYGHLTYDETRTYQISPKFSGWFEKLYVDFTGRIVKKGEPLFEAYSSELMAAQEEYLAAYRTYRRSGGDVKNSFLESAKRRLSLFDIAESEIREIERADVVKKTMTIRSPFTGVVIHKNAIEGGAFKPGTTIYTIADLSRIWVEAHIYEYELNRVSEGLEAEITLPYHPGETFSGKVGYVYPYLQQKTRDVVIRIELENPDFRLKPQMYADVRIKSHGDREEGLLVPSEAVIRSGERNIVFVAREGGKFIPREVTMGKAVDGGKTHILTGLAEGETIVVSGQFLIDSESKLKEAVQKMMEARQPASPESDEDDFFNDMEEDFFEDMK